MPRQDRYEHWLEHTTFPANPTFEQYAGMFAWDIAPEGGQIRSRLESDEKIADIQQWLTAEGTSSYSRYLILNAPVQSITPVSYTHLDVYKRQDGTYGVAAPGDVALAVARAAVAVEGGDAHQGGDLAASELA